MTHREKVKAVLEGEKPNTIPNYRECPMDVTVFKRDLARRIRECRNG